MGAIAPKGSNGGVSFHPISKMDVCISQLDSTLYILIKETVSNVL